ncbi:FtsH protease activity modulator HflK [Desulfosporosinus metallidurans]|uniref:Protein HflK n=1 Tax=Desulfosporosinus metallidurans TaxID=1888891 RepID=A0A1Q8QFY7_9FIRM|nr:FtsH protease activity modulator HflK [Desulfosporosinus metallidurans]OLN26256.1 HflK protein [Desulfosporosinus metallidurans]
MERKERTILIAIAANIILILLRFFLANISGSLGLQANAWHSLTDVFVSSVVFLGLFVGRIGARKYTNIIGRLENVLALFVAVFIFYMGLEILFEALGNEGRELKHVPFVAVGAFLGVIINYFMSRYKLFVGMQTNSQSLIADGYHSKMDMYCSIAVLIGITGSLFGMSSLEKITSIIAMVFMFIAAYEIFTINLRALLSGKSQFESHDHSHFKVSVKNKKAMVGLGAILVGAYVFSGVYFVKWDEQGIIRRFGAVAKENVSPGLHYKLPYPFEKVSLVKKDNIRNIQSGVNLLLTGDMNLINVNMGIQYKVSDAVNYALKVNNLDNLIKAVATTSIRQVVGEKNSDYLLTTGKSEVEERSKNLLQEALDKNNTGVQVVNMQLLEIAPPKEIVESFQDLASARQDKSTYINEAQAYRNTIIPVANGNAYKAIKEAEAYKYEKVKTAQGDALMFVQKFEEYQKSKGVTEYRLYMESLDKILPKVNKILIGGNLKVEGTDLWLTSDGAGNPIYNAGGNK